MTTTPKEILFEEEARERMRGRDEGDWPVLAQRPRTSVWNMDRRCRLFWNRHCRVDD